MLVAGLVFLLLVSSVNAGQIFYDNWQRDDCTPWVGDDVCDALLGYAEFSVPSGTKQLNRTVASTGDFQFYSEFVHSMNQGIFRFEFYSGNNRTMYVQFERTPTHTMRIYCNDALKNSTASGAAYGGIPLYGLWINRTGNLIEVSQNCTSPANCDAEYKYLKYDCSDVWATAPSIDKVRLFAQQSAGDWLVSLDDTTLYGAAALPPATYVWSNNTVCASDFVGIGSGALCIPDNIDIPADCSNTTSYMLGQILANPKATCSGDTEDVKVRTYNPITEYPYNNTTAIYGTCVDVQKSYRYNYNYSAGQTATGMVDATTSSLCTCWENWQVYGRLNVECIRPKETVILPNGTAAYCDPSTRYCSDNNLVHLDYDCNEISEPCPFGTECVNATCKTIPAGIPTNYSQPIVNVTELEEMGIGWTASFFTPFFISTLFLLIVSGYLAVKAKTNAGMVFGISAIVLTLIYTIIGIYPVWFGVVFIIIAAFIVAKLLGVLGGG
jgi:hypothetical protein